MIKKPCCSRFSLHKFVHLKFFWTQFKNVHLQDPCSLRPCISRPYCNTYYWAGKIAEKFPTSVVVRSRCEQSGRGKNQQIFCSTFTFRPCQLNLKSGLKCFSWRLGTTTQLWVSRSRYIKLWMQLGSFQTRLENQRNSHMKINVGLLISTITYRLNF